MKHMILVFSLLLICTTTLAIAQSDIVINEIMYNSDGDDVEFIELCNASQTTYNLQNWYVLDDNDDHTPCMLTGSLAAGAYLVVAGDKAAFLQKYPGVTNINTNAFNANGTGWSLGNGGDTVRLFDASQNLHDSVPYEDGNGWPTSPDGNGPSLELLHPSLDNTLPTSWDPSSVLNGTPGEQNSTYTTDVPPICKNGERLTSLPTSADNVVVTVLAYDNEGLAKVELFVNSGQGYVSQTMYDDGAHGDVTAGDSLYSTTISSHNSGTLVKYYAKATDTIGQSDLWPNNAPTEYHAYTVDYTPPKLRINEILAVNSSTNKDEAGEYDDWFEIYNAGPEAVNLGGMYVSNSLGSSRSFELPSINMAAGAYIILWADNDTDQGTRHVDFKLSADGEEVGLFETIDHGNVLIHGWKFGVMSADVSVGFLPETGNSADYLSTPTPGASNSTSSLFSPVCINEFETTSNFGGPQDDWVEIFNRGNAPFDISGCYLSDKRTNNTKWQFPAETVLDPGEFLVIFQDVLLFGFSSGGDDVIMLSAADSTVGLDFYDFKEQSPDKTEGRYPDGSNNWQVLSEPTRGTANKGFIAVEANPTAVPRDFVVHQNYPNPFNPSTTIRYELPATADVTIRIYDMTGRQVKTLVQNTQSAGAHSILWDATDDAGNPVSSGVYFYMVQTNSLKQVRKLTFIK
ncbi:lamin tail domain-containing protein [candidate division KSB1 bacterium]|nr:lamin tail domain-containing protein [candidate division KSB1 bacterium]